MTSRKIESYLFSILTFLMLCFPRILQIPKLLVLILLFVDIIMKRKIKFNNTLLHSMLLWISYYVFISIYGIILGNDQSNILAVARLNIVFFFLIMFIVNNLDANQDIFDGLVKTIVYSALYIGLFNILLVGLSSLGLYPQWLAQLDATARVNFHIGYSHNTSTNLSMTILIFPFLLFTLGDKELLHRIGKTTTIIAVILDAISMLFSGRRILWVILVVSLICYAFVYTKNYKKLLRNILLGLVLSAITIILLNNSTILDISYMKERFMAAFSATGELTGENIRLNQMDALVNAIKERPLFGYGGSASLGGWSSIRSETSVFEMSYHMIVFDGGFIGGGLYFISLLLMLKYILKVPNKSSLFYGTIFAFLSCLFANATNPYFSSSFDFLAMLSIPIFISNYMYANAYLAESKDITG